MTVKETLRQMNLDWANRYRHEKTVYLDKEAQNVIRAIKKRTRLGLDVDGKTFARYAKSYEQRKGQSKVDMRSNRRSRGRPLRGKHMMDSMVVRRVGTMSSVGYLQGREIRIAGSGRYKERLARLHAEGAPRVPMPPRDWFGLSGREARVMLNKVQEAYRREMPRDRRYSFRLRLWDSSGGRR
jgi:hypothetical protein